MKTGDLKRLAKLRMKGNWGVAIAVCVVLTIILSILSSGNLVPRIISIVGKVGSLGGSGSSSSGSNYTAAIVSAESQASSGALMAASSSFFGGFFGFALLVAQLILVGPLFFGFCGVFLDIIRVSRTKFADMFAGFKRFGVNMGTGLLLNLFVFLWSLLFVIPGIIKIYAYSMAWYIQKDHPEMKGTDAITASKNMMRGHKGKLFLLDLSFIGWYLLVPLTGGLILLYVMPYHNAARAAFYDSMMEKPVVEDPPKPVEDNPFGEPEAQPQAEPVVGQLRGDIVYDDDDPFAGDGGETIDGGD